MRREKLGLSLVMKGGFGILNCYVISEIPNSRSTNTHFEYVWNCHSFLNEGATILETAEKG
jgi:hypothetical protein